MNANAKTQRVLVRWRHVCLLVMVVLQQAAADVQLLSQEREVALVNGVPHEVDSATFLISSQSEAAIPVDATYTIRGSGANNNSVYTMHVRAKPPYRTYTRTLLGYIPRATHLIALEVCAGDSVKINATESLEVTFGGLLAHMGHIVELAAKHTRPKSPIDMMRAKTRSRTEEVIGTVYLYHLSKQTTPNMAYEGNFALYADPGGAAVATGAADRALGSAATGSSADLWLARFGNFGRGLGGLSLGIIAVAEIINVVHHWHDHGGGSGDDGLADVVAKLCHKVDDLYQRQIDFETRQTKTNIEVQQEFRTLSTAVTAIQSQVQRNTDSIYRLGTQLNTMADYQEAFSVAVARQFAATRAAIQVTGNVTQDIVDTMRYLHGQVEQQVQRIARVIRDNALQQTSFNNDILRLFKEVDLKRVLTAAYFAFLDAAPVPYTGMTPLAQNPGIRPMAFAARQALRNKEQAALVAEVMWSYTEVSNGTSNGIAHTDYVGLVCDREWLLNSTSATNDAYSLLNMIGPNANGTTEDCECCNDFDSNGAWGCQCAIRVRQTSCQTTSHTEPWPWFFDHINGGKGCVDLANCPDRATVCSGVFSDGLGSIRYFTNMTQFNAWYSPVCRSSNLVAYTGHKMRITQTNGPNYIEMALDDQTNQCEADYVTIDSEQGISPHEYPMWVTFQFWKSIFNGVTSAMYGSWERDFFGQLPSDTKTVKQHTNSYPNITTCYTSVSLTLALATTGAMAKVPVYVLEPGDLVHDVQVKFGDDGEFVQMGGTTGTTSIPIPDSFDGGAGNVTLTMASMFSSTADGALPKVSFLQVGEYNGFYMSGASQAGPVSAEAVPTRGDPYNKAYVYDVPFSQLPTGRTAYSKQGTVMYMLEPASWGGTTNSSAINATRFRVNTGLVYDPAGAAESVHRYIREGYYDAAANTYKCRKTFNYTDLGVSTYFGTQYTPEKHEWCTILDNFRVIESSDKTSMRFEYLNWNELVKLRVPAGTFTAVLQTACPGAYSVSNTTGSNTATMVLYSNSTTPVQWTVMIYDIKTGTPVNSGLLSSPFTAPATIAQPYSFTVSTPGNYSIQVFPLDQLNAPCFPGWGLPLGFSHQGHGSANMPYTEEQHIVYEADAGMLAAIEQSLKIQDYANQVVEKEREYQAAQDAAARARINNEINRIIAEARNTTNQIDTSPPLEAAAKRLAEQTQKTLERTRESASKNHVNAQLVNATLARLLQMANEVDNRTAQQEKDVDAQVQDLKDIEKLQDELINDLKDDQCDDSIPIIGPILCAIEKFMSGAIGGIFSFFALIFKVILLCLVLWVLFKLGMFCLDHTHCCKQKDQHTEKIEFEMHGQHSRRRDLQKPSENRPLLDPTSGRNSVGTPAVK